LVVIRFEYVAELRRTVTARAHEIARLKECPSRQVGSLGPKVDPDPGPIAAGGALWGRVKAHGFLPGMVIAGDD
jgi:hypothetical protein